MKRNGSGPEVVGLGPGSGPGPGARAGWGPRSVDRRAVRAPWAVC